MHKTTDLHWSMGIDTFVSDLILYGSSNCYVRLHEMCSELVSTGFYRNHISKGDLIAIARQLLLLHTYEGKKPTAGRASRWKV